MKATEKLLWELRVLEDCDVCDWIHVVRTVGRNPANFFERKDWTGTDFSMSNMSGVSFRGATLDHSIFRRGDLSRKILDEARSVVGAREQAEQEMFLNGKEPQVFFPRARADRQQVWLNWLSSSADKWNNWRKTTMVVPDFEGRDLTAHFLRSDFECSELNDLDLKQADFKRARMTGLTFSGCNFEGANLEYADLTEVVFKNCNLKDAQLRYANLQGSDLRRSDLTGVSLREANISGASFEASTLTEIDFSGSTLEYVDLTNQSLKSFRFNRGKLRGANFAGADLEGSSFSKTDLSEARFWGANLEMTNLSSAKLENCDFGHALLSGACVRTQRGNSPISRPKVVDLSKVKNLTQDQLHDMDGDSGTILPFGLSMPKDWPQVTHETLWPDPKSQPS